MQVPTTVLAEQVQTNPVPILRNWEKKERKKEREKENEHGMHGQEKSEWDMEHRARCSVIAMDVPAKEQGGAAAQDVNPRPLFLHQRRAPSGESPPHLLPLGHDRYC
ncbi:unnamed protein product [Musa hybrid cultivar]